MLFTCTDSSLCPHFTTTYVTVFITAPLITAGSFPGMTACQQREPPLLFPLTSVLVEYDIWWHTVGTVGSQTILKANEAFGNLTHGNSLHTPHSIRRPRMLFASVEMFWKRISGPPVQELEYSQLLCYTHNFFQTFHLLTITRSSRFVSELERKCAVQVIKLKLHVPSQGLLREKRVMAFHIHDFCVHFLNRADSKIT